MYCVQMHACSRYYYYIYFLSVARYNYVCICLLCHYVGDERAPTTVVQRLGSELVKSTYALLSSYWVLVVVVAFLLVFLSGEPSLLKTIYLIFFFVFLITYQVSLIYTSIRNGVYKNYVHVHTCERTFMFSSALRKIALLMYMFVICYLARVIHFQLLHGSSLG